MISVRIEGGASSCLHPAKGMKEALGKEQTAAPSWPWPSEANTGEAAVLSAGIWCREHPPSCSPAVWQRWRSQGRPSCPLIPTAELALMPSQRSQALILLAEPGLGSVSAPPQAVPAGREVSPPCCRLPRTGARKNTAQKMGSAPKNLHPTHTWAAGRCPPATSFGVPIGGEGRGQSRHRAVWLWFSA